MLFLLVCSLLFFSIYDKNMKLLSTFSEIEPLPLSFLLLLHCPNSLSTTNSHSLSFQFIFVHFAFYVHTIDPYAIFHFPFECPTKIINNILSFPTFRYKVLVQRKRDRQLPVTKLTQRDSQDALRTCPGHSRAAGLLPASFVP